MDHLKQIICQEYVLLLMPMLSKLGESDETKECVIKEVWLRHADELKDNKMFVAWRKRYVWAKHFSSTKRGHQRIVLTKAAPPVSTIEDPSGWMQNAEEIRLIDYLDPQILSFFPGRTARSLAPGWSFDWWEGS